MCLELCCCNAQLYSSCCHSVKGNNKVNCNPQATATKWEAALSMIVIPIEVFQRNVLTNRHQAAACEPGACEESFALSDSLRMLLTRSSHKISAFFP